MSDPKNSDSVTVRSDGFASGSIALLFITFIVALNSVASLFLVCTQVMVDAWLPDWEVEPDPLDLMWSVGLAIVAVRLRAFHVAYLKFLQGRETEKYKAEQAKLWNTIGCLCAVLLVYEFALKIWIVWELWSTPRFIPGGASE